MSAEAKLTVRKGASTSRDPDVAARELAVALKDPGATFTVFYCSPQYDLDALAAALVREFGSQPLIGCTTAGEITPLGYLDGSLTGVSLGGASFGAWSSRIDRLHDFQFAQGQTAATEVIRRLQDAGHYPSSQTCFGFLLIDGLSLQEEGLVSALHRSIGDVQLFGGSAADGLRFKKTFLYHDGKFRSDCAIFTLVHTTAPFRVFKTQHFIPSETKMVVTGADPARRVVREINGEPASEEYARVVGLDPLDMTPLAISAHPVLVRAGASAYVRSIQSVGEDRSLTFFCAIDEGTVLTVANAIDLVRNLEQTFSEVRAAVGRPAIVLGCDCILRHQEIGHTGALEAVSRIFVDNNVVGFSTYGEQFNAMHVNQTFTGVAIGEEQ